MKNEDTQQPTTSTFSAAQWPQNTQIPIDPALQQQSQHAQQHVTHQTHTTHTAHTAHPTTTTYSHYQYGHYPQTNYTHYPHYAPQNPQPPATQQTQTQQQAQQGQQQPTVAAIPTASRPTAPPTQQQSNVMDTTDVATLNDALGSAGVDLRAEEENMQRSNDTYYSYRPYEDRSHKQPTKPNFDTRIIGQTMRNIGSQHKVPKIPEDSVNYLALALRTRLQDLLTAMIAAAQHRTDAQFDRPASTYEDGRPMWSIVVRTDVAKQLAVIERVEREEEMRIRRERKERQEATAAAQSAAVASAANGAAAESMGGDDEGGPKKKKKKEGPGVTARNMPEDLRKKMSNAVAKQAAGLGTSKYAWMTAGGAANGGGTPAKSKSTGSAPTPRASTPATTTAPAQSSSASGWARPYQSSKPNAQQQQQTKEEDGRLAVTLRDAMFVVENERGHGGGRGAARGWT